MMDIHRILDKLPHRYPFLLVDRVLDVDVAGKRLRALKNVTANEPFFVGHFPKRPVMPGVLMLEALAQASALLSFETEGISLDDSQVFYFVGIDGARFKRPVEPGDQLILITQEGMIIRTAVDGIREIGRSTQGVRLINLEGDDRLVAIAKVLERDDDPEGLAELPPEEDDGQGTIE